MSAVTDQRQHAAATGSRGLLPVPRPLLRMRSDAALAERVTGGDEAAFDVLYERHRAVVLAVAMGVLGTTHDAEDATQETFSALAVALRTKPPAELRPWLIRVARNAAIDTTRRRRHRLLTLDGELPEVQARPIGGGKAELAVVFDGIRELPEGQRMALLMRELGGHSYSEIAEFLETDEDAVKGLIARARVGLRAFREASELSCASARTTIAAEPDGRRYDKTVRRHLRTCASCRSYRDALRDDAKALRAGLPLQAGGVAAGTGISAGPLAAAKGAMVGYSLTQAAAACAASACAVGAVGGIVLIGPVHRFGIPPILPVQKHATAHRADAKLATAHKHVKVSTQPQVTEQHASYAAVSHTAATAADASRRAAAVSHAVAAIKHHHHRDHHAVAVKRSKVHLKAAATTSPVTLSTGSSPTITPAPSAPAQTQPATPSTPAPVQTTTATPSPVQSTSATQGSGTSAPAAQGSGTSAAAAQGSGTNAGATYPQTPGTTTGTADSPSAVSSATTPTSGVSSTGSDITSSTGSSPTPTTGTTTTPTTGTTTPTTGTTTPTTGTSTIPTTGTSTIPTNGSSTSTAPTTSTTTTTTTSAAPPSSTFQTPPATTTPTGTATTPADAGADTATPPSYTAITPTDAGTDTATPPFSQTGTPTE